LTFVFDNVRQLGYSPQAFLSRNLFFKDIIHPEDLSWRMEQVSQVSIGSAGEFVQEYRVVTKTGEIKWIEDRTWVQRDSEGRVAQYHGVVMDVTHRKKNEVERKALEDQLARSKKNRGAGYVGGRRGP
jgi:PAS domain S-box-containing protein